jgi:hypothetical protein
MRGRAFEHMIGAALARGRGDVETRSLALRRAGLWPSGRGRYGPELSRDAIAAGLLAHFGAAKPSQATPASIAFGELVEQVTLGRRLIKVLSSVLSDPGEAQGVQMILLNRTQLSAQIVLRDGRTRLFLPKSASEPDAPVSFACAGEAGIIGGDMLLALASQAQGAGPSDAPQIAVE